MLRNQANVFATPFDSYLYCYSVFQPLYSEMMKAVKNIEFFHGLPELSYITKNKNVLVFFDDLLDAISKSKETTPLWTKFRHYNVSMAILALLSVLLYCFCIV